MSKLAQISPAIWVKENNLVNEKGEIITFDNHLFLWQIYADMNPEQVIKKCAQVGVSVTMNLKVFHLAKYRGITTIYCVDEQTEILTKRGWLKYDDLNLKDKILTLSKTGVSRFTKIEEIFKKEVEMKMTSFEARNFSALTTNNHKWVVKKGYGKDESLFFETTKNLPNKYYFIPKRAENVLWRKKKVYSDELVALLGWIFTEGCYTKSRAKNGGLDDTRMSITQSVRVNSDKCETIRGLLNYLKISFKEYKPSKNGCINFYLKGEIPLWIKRKFTNKLPTIDFINELTKEQIILFIDTIVAGDGWIDQWGTKNVIQKDKRLLDILSYAGVIVGYVPRVNKRNGKDKCWYLKLTCFDYIWTNALKPKEVDYKGIIWCPRTKYGTFYARRNGYCYWTGNTMPTDNDVWEFVKTKTDKIYSSNPVLRENLVSDNIGLKQVGSNFVYYKGTVSKSASISTTADLLLHDELDRSELSIIEQYRSRISASKYKGIWKISNPSLTGVGVDEDWAKSDKKEWFIKCKGCGEEQYLNWDDNVDEIKGIYVCKACGRELSDRERRAGQWKPTADGRISGYHISQMVASWLSAKDLIKEKEERGIEYFYNFVLGEPYSVGDALDFRRIIEDCWTSEPQDKEPFYMGIDIGKVKHYVIGSQKGIFKIGKCESREELEDLLRRYNPRYVIDAGPERTWAEEIRKKFPKGTLCFLNKKNDAKAIVEWGGEKNTDEDRKKVGYVFVDRNRALDQMIYEMSRGEFLYSVDSKTLEAFIQHWISMRRIIEGSKQNKRYVWVSSNGEDHWCFANLYYWLARQRGQKATFIVDKIEKKDVITRTADGFEFRNLEDIINENNL